MTAARPRQPGAGRGARGAGAQALAHLEPLPDPQPGGAGRAAGGGDLRRHRLRDQLGHRGDRVRDQDGAQALRPCRPAGAEPDHRLRGRRSTAAATARSRRRARRRWSRASGRCCRASTTCRSSTSPRCEAAIGPETAAVLIEPIQGEGGIRALPREDLRGPARALRRDRHAPDPRRDPVRHGPDRQALPPRVGRDHARHHDGGQGHRRRLPARRLPRHRGGGRRHDRSAPTARPTAATRSPARSAAR